jgi:hypothetical protein
MAGREPVRRDPSTPPRPTPKGDARPWSPCRMGTVCRRRRWGFAQSPSTMDWSCRDKGDSPSRERGDPAIRSEHQNLGVPLAHYREHGANVELTCLDCIKRRTWPREAVISRLVARDRQTGIKAAAWFVAEPCTRCGGRRFEIRPDFPSIPKGEGWTVSVLRRRGGRIGRLPLANSIVTAELAI